jgi:hypothetical protein
MVVIAVLLLAFLPPGILFPQMAARMAARKKKKNADKAAQNSESSQQDVEMSAPVVHESKPAL